AILWRQVRAKRFDGYKFRRQQQLGQFIVYFVCSRARLVVELDGESHVGNEVADADRQRAIEGLGYRVLRFLNSDVYDDLDVVLESVWRACDAGASGQATGA
ncbi:MAG: endonuclease domain-containing protein, partial [Fimbriiglobus sp.]|nr:endonuclease domain-containing protein [Fimbriiglobus sp.]